jgi:hypothetical protein
MKILMGKPAWFLIAILLIASLGLAFLHTHEDGHHTVDCALCRIVAQFVFILTCALIAIVKSLRNVSFFERASFNFHSYLGSTALKDRAPPFFAI